MGSTYRQSLLTDFSADDFSRDDDFHPPVLLAARRRAVVGYRHRLAKSRGGQIGIRQSLFDQVLSNRLSPLLGEFLVELIAPGAIGVSFNGEIQSRMSQHNAGEPGQFLPCDRSKVESGGIEQHIGHVDHQSTRRVPGIQDTVELFQQLGAESLGGLARLFRFGLGCLFLGL